MRLNAVTPVHIGSGNTYTRAEYVKVVRENDAWLHRINFDAMMRKLPEKKREDFLVEMGEGFSLTSFLKGIGHEDAKRYSIYYPPREGEPSPIRECIKTGDIAYIPGSSIKGAVRTALLWNFVIQHKNEYCEQLRESANRSDRRLKKQTVGASVVDHIFSTTNERPDAKFDILKFVEISDFMPPAGKENHKLENIKTYTLQRQGGLRPKNYDNFCECVVGDFTGTVRLSPQIGAALKSREKFPLLESKLSILGLDKELSDDALMKHIQQSLRKFQSSCLDQELALCDLGGNDDFVNYIRTLQKKNSEEYLIRLGAGVGTLYQTMMGLIAEHDPDLALAFINEFKLGKYPRTLIHGKELDPPYPKSIEFTTNKKPVGWMAWQF